METMLNSQSKAVNKVDELKHQITQLQQMTSTRVRTRAALKKCKTLNRWFALKYSKAWHAKSTEINVNFLLRLMDLQLFYSSQSCKISRFLTLSSGTLTHVHNRKYMSWCNDSKETADILELEQGRLFNFCNQNIKEKKVQGILSLLRSSWNTDLFFLNIENSSPEKPCRNNTRNKLSTMRNVCILRVPSVQCLPLNNCLALNLFNIFCSPRTLLC